MKQSKGNTYGSLTLLGNSAAEFPKAPETGTLETFTNPRASRDYWIHVDCPDFTSLCPVTGQPDFAEIKIDYVPAKLCLETKSLKFYLSAFRNVHSFNEEVINRILDDLVSTCRPRRMRVEGQFAARGGLALTVVAEHPSKQGSAKSARKS
jgi:7-cyano-7-deazaguanine reductase